MSYRLNILTYSFLEFILSFIPFISLLFIMSPSIILLYQQDLFNSYSMSAKTFGQQWSWNYAITYFTSITSSYNLTLSQIVLNSNCLYFPSSFSYLTSVKSNLFFPILQSIKLYLSSIDVIHSWGIYSFGTKLDSIPSRLNVASNLELYFQGVHFGFCYELCGSGHYGMQIKVQVI